MNKIEVKVLGTYGDPGAMAAFLARLTQRGHNIKSMKDLEELYAKNASTKFIESLAALPHGTIKRFTPITIAIVGASRRFLAQARTNQVGFNYVSASLQYSDYSDSADFVVPYALMEASHNCQANGVQQYIDPVEAYLSTCNSAMKVYGAMADITDNDTAGYVAPQGLRNILIMQGNHQSWDYFFRMRSCNRNTVETQYVTMLIWEALLNTKDGPELFKYAGADCVFGACKEGKMCCGDPLRKYRKIAEETGATLPRVIINDRWPLLAK